MYFASLIQLLDFLKSLNLSSHDDLMIWVGEDSAAYVPQLINTLNSLNLPFFGGIYPRLIVKDTFYTKGFVIKKYKPLYRGIVLPYMMPFKPNVDELKDTTALLLVDGLSSQYQTLINTVYDKLGNTVDYIGGGAGFYDLHQQPCLFTEKGLLKDALIICILPNACKHAVSHGWRVLEGPYRITKSLDNILYSLENDNPFDIYSDTIEAHERIHLFQSDFYVYAKEHPFGMMHPNSNELIVRDPISVNDKGEITCIANLPEDSNIYILHGNTASLLLSASAIVNECTKQLSSDQYEPLLFDCISREMFLEDFFKQELISIQSNLNAPVFGTLCVGEIASCKGHAPIIHNKSTVLALLN